MTDTARRTVFLLVTLLFTVLLGLSTTQAFTSNIEPTPESSQSENNTKQVTTVSPQGVTFTDTCDGSGQVIIPNSEGVRYSIDGTTVGSGEHIFKTGESVTVNATAEEDYRIKEGATTEWTHTFIAPENCVLNGSTTNRTTPPSTTPPQTSSTSTTIPSNLPSSGSTTVITIAILSALAILIALTSVAIKKVFVRLS